MKTQFEEMQSIVELIKDKTYTGFKNLESVSTGSFHKEKDDIVDNVCQTARKYRRLTSTLHSCLEWLLDGKTIADFYHHKLEQSTRINQCEQDRIESMEEIEMFTHLIVEVKPMKENTKPTQEEQKTYCQMFKRGTSHWGNKVLKRCKSVGIKDFNGKKFCVNCFEKLKQKGGETNG